MRSKRVVKKSELDRQVALLLGMKQRDISNVTAEFLLAIQRALVDLNEVHLDGLGHLRIYTQVGAVDKLKPSNTGKTLRVKSKKKYRVSFKKAAPFTLALRRKLGGAEIETVQMEKFGVDEAHADNEKVASNGCPECGAKVERHGNVLACAVHGTEPFERKRKED